jgi:hypothetical protein
MLVDRNIMDIFAGLNSLDNVVIQTNVSWMFLALANNMVGSRQMLEHGITRDLFSAACLTEQIRHLVVAGFAELGKNN